MNWQLIYVLLTLNLTAATLGLAYFAWKHRSRKGALSFAALMLTVAVVSLPYAAALASDTLRQVIFWNKMQYFGLSVLPVVWLIFAFEYTDNRRWLKLQNLVQLLIVPFITLLLALTNEEHGLIWEKTRLADVGSFSTFDPVHGFWFWIFMSYSYVLLGFGSITLLRKALNTWSLYRRQAAAIFLGTLLPWVGNLMLIFDLKPFPELNPIPIFFNLGCICFAWAVFRLSMLDIVPVSYEDVIESLPDGVLTVDINNRVTAVNSIIRPFLNREPNKILARHIEDVFADIPPEFKHLYRAKDARTEIDTGSTSIEVRVSPLYNRRKQFMGRLLLFRDITHRKRAESALKQRLEHLSIIREAYEEIGSTLNLDKILSLAVDAAMRLSKSQAGYIALLDQEELHIAASTGYGEQSDTHKLILKADRIILDRVVTSRKAQLLLDVFLESTYSPFLFDTKAKIVVPLISQNTLIGLMNVETANPDHYTSEIFDFMQILASRIAAAIDNAHLHLSLQNRLGEVHQLYQKVSQLEQLKTDMIRIAAHDIRNPLMAISIALEMLNEDQTADLPKLYVQSIHNAANRISHISEGILSLERIEAMATGVNMQIVNLCEPARQAAQDFADMAAQRSQQFVTDVDGEAFVRGDAMQLYEAITNLIGNAVKYTPEGGKIKVSLSQQAQEVIFTVEDTGYGIPDDKHERLFQPFFRVKTRETQEIEGAGLGLHLVKNIVDRHHGKIIFRSTYGKGSVFGFSLPIAQM